MNKAELIARTVAGYDPSEEEMGFYDEQTRAAVVRILAAPPDRRRAAFYDFAATQQNELELLESVWRANWAISSSKPSARVPLKRRP